MIRMASVFIIALLSVSLVACSSNGQEPLPKISDEASETQTQATRSSKNEDGIITIDSKPFFPYGFYIDTEMTYEQRKHVLQKMGEGDFNTITADSKNVTLQQFLTLYDDAEMNEIKVMSHQGYNGPNGDTPTFDPYDTQLVNLVKNKPAHLAWTIADDAMNFYTPAELLELQKVIKFADPNHINAISINNAATVLDAGLDGYTNTTDAVAMQAYLIFNGETPDMNIMESFNIWQKQVDSAEKFGKVPLANLQTFNWNREGANDRWVTPAEVEVLSYLAFAAGMKGIINYTSYDAALDTTLDVSQPEIWKATETIARELETLAPILLKGERLTERLSYDGRLVVGHWEYAGKLYLVVINSAEVPLEVYAYLKCSFGNAKPLFANRPATLSFEDCTVGGKMGPMEVQVYELQNLSVQ